MAPKKISRKELLAQTDEFITLTDRVARFILAHQKWFLTGLVIVLVVAVAVMGWRSYRDRQARLAFRSYDQALALVPKAKDLGSEAADQQMKAALVALAGVRQGYPNSTPGRLVLLDLGALYYHMGRYDEAKEAYQAFLKKLGSGEKDLRPLVLNSLAYIHEAQNDPAGAAALWEEITQGPVELLKAEAWYNLGRAYTALNQPDKARKAYQQLIDRFPESPNLPLARTKLAQLSG
jgi:tetratricopeptide (TPR) repeat protein